MDQAIFIAANPDTRGTMRSMVEGRCHERSAQPDRPL
jgi:hypothetical protein